MWQGRDYCSNCAPKHVIDGIDVGIYMSDLSAFWMVLPYFLTGIGEALVQPVIQYYAYACSPTSTRAFVQALVLVFTGMYPLSLVTVFTTLLKHHLRNNLNKKSDDVAGISIGIEVFYYIGLLFAVVGIPLTYFVLKRVTEAPIPDSEAYQALTYDQPNPVTDDLEHNESTVLETSAVSDALDKEAGNLFRYYK